MISDDDDGDGNIMIVDSSGNVGIGTRSPNNILDILGNASGLFDMEIKNTNTGTTAGARILVHNGASASSFEKMSTGATYGGARKASAGVIFDSSTSGGLSLVAGGASADLRLYSGGSADANERVTVKSDGKVGIGEISPETKLEVLDTNTQLLLTYSDGIDTEFFVDSNGDLHIEPSGSDIFITSLTQGSVLFALGRGIHLILLKFQAPLQQLP
jgi:hypothetical protein